MAVVTNSWAISNTGATLDITSTNVTQTLGSVLSLPPATDVVILSMTSVDDFRQNEIHAAWIQLRDHIIEQRIIGSIPIDPLPALGDVHFELAIGAGKAQVDDVADALGVGSFTPGALGISISASASLAKGNGIFHSMVRVGMIHAKDNYFKGV